MKQQELRSEKLLRNAFWSIAGYLGYAIVGFLSRSFFVNRLGETITGVSTLFNSMLLLLSMAELGFSSAISMHLYKPVAEGDEKKISALMNLYKKAYQGVALAILVLGLVMMPVIPFFAKTDTVIPHLRWYFFLYIVKTVLSYCYAYKGTLLAACQEDYRRTNIINLLLIITTIAQTIILHYTANFTLYLLLMILGTLVTNLLVHREAGKLHPYLDKYKDEQISAEEKKSIFTFIKAQFLNKISLSIKTATDNMITSAFVHVVVTGIVGNYVMVISTVEKLLGYVFWNCQPAIGNMTVTTEKDNQFDTFLDLEYLAFWVYGFLSAGMLCVLSPFVRDIWIRQDTMVLNNSTLFLLILNFFLIGTNFPATLFFEVRGLIAKMPYINALNVVINLIVSLTLVRWYDVNGVYIGTIVSLVLTTLPLTHYLVLRYHFDGRYMPYLRKYLYYLLVTGICCCSSSFFCSLVQTAGFLGIIYRILICTAVYNVLFLLASFRSREFISLFGLVKTLLNRQKRTL